MTFNHYRSDLRYITRMHSSRMSTSRFSGRFYWGVSACGSRGVCLWDQGRGWLPTSGSGGCLPLGLGMSATPPPTTHPVHHTPPFTTPPFTTPPFTTPHSLHTPCHHTTPCGQTNTCENITLPQTSFAGGKYLNVVSNSYKATCHIIEERMKKNANE